MPVGVMIDLWDSGPVHEKRDKFEAQAGCLYGLLFGVMVAVSLWSHCASGEPWTGPSGWGWATIGAVAFLALLLLWRSFRSRR